MSNPIDDMMQPVYSMLLSGYQSQTGSLSAVLAFEPIGIPLSDSMFALPGATAPSGEMAIEQVSELANFLPGIANGMIEMSDRTVDGFYAALLGAQPGAGTDAGSFAAGLAAAKQSFDLTLNTYELPNYPYHPIFATPPDWYDASNSQNWSQYSSGQNASSAGGATPPPNPPVAPPSLPPIRWHVPPMADQVPGVDRIPVDEQPITLRPGFIRNELSVRPMAATVSPAVSIPMSAVQVATPMTALQVATPTTALSVNRSAMLSAALQVRQQAAAAPQQPVTSTGPSINFDYCLVRMQRRWLSEAFLSSPGWYLNGYQAGSLSGGAASPPTQAFDAVPAAFIVVRNLKIQATWSPEDSQAIQNAAGVGPFSLAGRSFDSSTLSRDGMQIIGWVCERQPLLPPLSDPALAAAAAPAPDPAASNSTPAAA
jgi:hypothetical protein